MGARSTRSNVAAQDRPAPGPPRSSLRFERISESHTRVKRIVERARGCSIES